MIIVTGVPRARTSLAMQTLKILGVPITGDQYNFRNIPTHNPKGYWELNAVETQRGIKTHKYKGKAVKLFGEGLSLTYPGYINRIIWCTRWKNNAVKSFMKLLLDNPSFGLKPTRKNAETVYENNQRKVEYFMSKNIGFPVIKIDYKEWNNPKRVISHIVKFLGLQNVNIKKAIENVEV